MNIGPIYLFGVETDLNTYQQSIGKLAILASQLQKVFPSHNIPVAAPDQLIEANNAFNSIKSGKITGKVIDDTTLLFGFNKFSFLIEKKLLKVRQ